MQPALNQAVVVNFIENTTQGKEKSRIYFEIIRFFIVLSVFVSIGWVFIGALIGAFAVGAARG